MTPSLKNKKLPRKTTAGSKSKKSEAKKELKSSPNLFFLGLAGAAILGSTLLTLSNNGKRKLIGRVLGMWVPSLLTMSLYNKVAHAENADHHQILDVVKH